LPGQGNIVAGQVGLILDLTHNQAGDCGFIASQDFKTVEAFGMQGGGRRSQFDFYGA